MRASLVDQLNLRSRLAGGAEQSELHRANIIGPVPPVAAETRELWENYGPLGPLKIENSSRFSGKSFGNRLLFGSTKNILQFDIKYKTVES